MIASDIWAVVPVKPFRIAKQRLACILQTSERAHLARIMAEDVLDALAASMDVLAGVIVVTSDVQAAALARRRGLQPLIEPQPAGINRALTYAIAQMPRARAGMIVVPADLPQITPGAIEKLGSLLTAPPAVALVPASSDAGTNVFACRPVGLVPPTFGAESFARHRQCAMSAGIAPALLPWPDLGCDIDRPADLAAFLALRTATRTHDFLARHAVRERPPDFNLQAAAGTS